MALNMRALSGAGTSTSYPSCRLQCPSAHASPCHRLPSAAAPKASSPARVTAPQPSHSRRGVRTHAAVEYVSPVEPMSSVPWHQLGKKDVLHANQFNKASLDLLFEEAEKMELVRPRTPESKMLEGYIMSTLFYEPSTRTRLSFESAMARLGGTVISTESAGEYSSAAKGETLEDTIRTVEGYADCIVLRHFQEGYARRAANASHIPIINAGDGPGQHPTQALLDVYTIKRELGRLENIKIGMVGDLLNGRTVRSLAYVLSLYPGLQVYFVAPSVVRMRDDIKELLTSRNVPWREVDDLREVAADVDVLYMTRIQKERFSNMEEYEQARGKYIVDKELMKSMQKHAVVMHPLPRVDEIAEEVDEDPRAAYFRQARNGLYIRMALLKLAILGVN